MLDYQSGQMCRMRFLAESLDDPSAHDCGRCDVCARVWWDTSVDQTNTSGARQVLSGIGVPVDPRGQWPSGMDKVGVPLKGKIPAEEKVAEGRVIARFTDLGPGQVLRTFLQTGAEDAPVPKNIADWCIQVLKEWGWDQRPATVVAMPSVTRPVTTSALASGLAQVGQMTDAGALEYTEDPGDPDVNSAFRVCNLNGAVHVPPEVAAAVSGQVVLLVDTEIGSRWAMTVAGRELLRTGAAAVLPFALAMRA